MLLIRNGYVITPGAVSQQRDLFICDGKIVPMETLPDELTEVSVLDATGLVVAPGLVDMHVHLRDPGFTHKEDILSGAAAAAAGGVTTMACMPNTSPALDSPERIADIISRAQRAPVRIVPYAAVTVSQRGDALTDAAALREAGAVGLSDDGNPVMSAAIMRQALRAANAHQLVISSHCEDAGLVKNYALNEGELSARLNIPGRPRVAEALMVSRDILLARDTGAHVHIAHVSTAESVALIRSAKAEGVHVTAETCPQYFTLTEDEIAKQGALAKVNPPLRTQADIDAIIDGLADGTLDAIATDHAPHAKDEKNRPLIEAPSGISGLETSLALSLTALFHTGRIPLERLLELLSTNPASILGISGGSLNDGDNADIVIFDPYDIWTVDPDRFMSRGRNTPFAGMKLRGKVRCTLVGGVVVYRND